MVFVTWAEREAEGEMDEKGERYIEIERESVRTKGKEREK